MKSNMDKKSKLKKEGQELAKKQLMIQQYN